MTLIDPDEFGPRPRHVRIPLAEFLAIPPFPGHRDSERRATTSESDHLKTFDAQHAEVELAECPDGAGGKLRFRLTGNTRAAKWRDGDTDVVPSFVNATLYSCEDVAAVSRKGLLLDSPKAAWRPGDYAYRAYSMIFPDGWRPSTAIVRKAGRAIQLADAYVHGLYNSERGVLIEQVLPDWKAEVRTFDEVCQQPLSIERGNLSTGIQAACLLLLKFEDTNLVRLFLQTVFSDGGTKNGAGMDGVQCMVETIKARASRRGKPSRQVDLDDVKKTLTAYTVFAADGRHQRIPNRIDPVAYAKLKTRHADTKVGEKASHTPPRSRGNAAPSDSVDP